MDPYLIIDVDVVLDTVLDYPKSLSAHCKINLQQKNVFKVTRAGKRQQHSSSSLLMPNLRLLDL